MPFGHSKLCALPIVEGATLLQHLARAIKIIPVDDISILLRVILPLPSLTGWTC
jgi:hypothetical protein